jgi:hypothetical protein
MSVFSAAEAAARTRTGPLGHELGTFHLGDNSLYLAFCARCKAVVYFSSAGGLRGAALSQRCEVLRAKWGGAIDAVKRS